VTFSGSFSAFIGMIFSKNRLQHGLHVRGDMDCAKALYDTWRYLDLDWEGYLATFVGGDAANMLSKGFNQWKTWAKDNVDSGIENVGAYLQDETQWLPTQNEIEHFLQEIDKLRLDVDRVEARLSLLQKNYQQG
jgi:ubiquinone biosynthesis protein UbiJ